MYGSFELWHSKRNDLCGKAQTVSRPPISHPIQQQALLNSASAEQVRCLCNCLENIPYQEDKHRPFKRELAELTDRNSSFKRKKQILVQRGGGFLGVVLGPILEALAELK